MSDGVGARRNGRTSREVLAPALDEIDKAIIRALQVDGRMSYAKLGPEVGLSQAAVRQRVQRLTDSGVVQVVAVTHAPQVAARADRVVSRVRAIPGDVLLFTSGHFIRVLAARWLGLEPSVNSRYFMLSTASLSALGYERERSRPVIRLWNETRHVDTTPR